MILLRKVFACVFFFNDTATTEIYTLSLHDVLPIVTHDVPVANQQHPLRIVAVLIGIEGQVRLLQELHYIGGYKGAILEGRYLDLLKMSLFQAIADRSQSAQHYQDTQNQQNAYPHRDRKSVV